MIPSFVNLVSLPQCGHVTTHSQLGTSKSRDRPIGQRSSALILRVSPYVRPHAGHGCADNLECICIFLRFRCSHKQKNPWSKTPKTKSPARIQNGLSASIFIWR